MTSQYMTGETAHDAQLRADEYLVLFNRGHGTGGSTLNPERCVKVRAATPVQAIVKVADSNRKSRHQRINGILIDGQWWTTWERNEPRNPPTRPVPVECPPWASR